MVVSRKSEIPKVKIHLDGQEVEQVSKFVYLGELVTENGIINEPYPTRENGPTGLRKIPYKPLHKYQLRELLNTLKATIFTNRNYIWHTVSMGANKGWDCK